MVVEDLGFMPYRQAWSRQEAVHGQVATGGEEALLLVEHPPVITYGRRPGGEKNLLTPEPQLAGMGVELVQSDRGGDITFHGPGQIVAYPIIRLADHGLSVSGYVHSLEKIIIETLHEFGISGHQDPEAIGVWVGDAKVSDTFGGPVSPRPCTQGRGAGGEGFFGFSGLESNLESAKNPSPQPSPLSTGAREQIELPPTYDAKIAAIGVRIRRGVSLHGIALNVETDLRYFDLIVPCGLASRPVTSIRKILGADGPSIEQVREAVVRQFRETFKN